MRLDTFLLADAASIHEGKLYVHGGGITRITAPVIPFVLPHLALVIRLKVEEEELERDHVLTITLTDPEGEVVIPPTSLDMAAQPLPDIPEGEEHFLQLALGFGSIPLLRPGVFRLKVSLDKRSLRTVDLPVVSLTGGDVVNVTEAVPARTQRKPRRSKAATSARRPRTTRKKR